MIRATMLLISLVAIAWANTNLLLAETQVVVAAGTAGEPRGGNQFEVAIAAAAGVDEQNQAIAGGLVQINFMSSVDGIEAVTATVDGVDFFSEDGTPIRAVLSCTADVKLHNGRRFRGVEGTVSVSDKRKQSLYFPEVMLEPIQDAVVLTGGSSIEVWEDPFLLFNASGVATDVESAFQAAGVVSPDGRAIGHLSLMANRDNGDTVYVNAICTGVSVLAYRGKRRLQLRMLGAAAVDVFHPDGTTSDTCFGAFSFVSNEGPHGPYRLDMPDCEDALEGIEGLDIGSGPAKAAVIEFPTP